MDIPESFQRVSLYILEKIIHAQPPFFEKLLKVFDRILQEQRAHIQILDSALSNAQATILRLEEENRMKEGYAERVKQMTRSLEQLQAG